MADEQIALTITKSDEPFDMPSLEFNQVELGKTLNVTVTDIDGKPYDLTNKQIQFVDKFSDAGKGIIIDNGMADKAGKFIRLDDLNGKFKYVFQENVYQGAGQCSFEFLSDGKVDSTNPFYIDIQIKLANDLRLDNASYIADLSSLEANFRRVINEASFKTDATVKDFQEKTQQAIVNGQKKY